MTDLSVERVQDGGSSVDESLHQQPGAQAQVSQPPHCLGDVVGVHLPAAVLSCLHTAVCGILDHA